MSQQTEAQWANWNKPRRGRGVAIAVGVLVFLMGTAVVLALFMGDASAAGGCGGG
jgi:hypothetical protein